MVVTLTMKTRTDLKKRAAFTLIELLVVISIIAVLMGLAFPAFQGVQNAAKKTQAKNDLVQIVTAVNAFYTEYGRYPTTATGDAASTVGGLSSSNKILFDELRGLSASTLNPRQISFISPPDAKDQTHPKGGIQTTTGDWYDPWGTKYLITMDADYDNKIANPYSANTGAGATDIRQGVISYSLGKDLSGGSGNKNSGTSKDDVISWQ